MDEHHLDLGAPLLSFRRITVHEAGEKIAGALPFCKSDLMFAQVGAPGAVPFMWEKKPGQPKDASSAKFEPNPIVPNLPPVRSLKGSGTDWFKVDSEDEEESYSTVCDEEDEAFCDAPDAFSCAESFSMKCVRDSSRSFAKDPEVKELMMGRFLPAAQAMVEDSAQRSWRKPLRAQVDEVENIGRKSVRRRRLPVEYQYHLSRAQLHSNEEEEGEGMDDGYGSFVGCSFFSSKACGLMQRFCFKSSICPVNSALGLKLQGREKSRSYIGNTILRGASLGQDEDEDSWEAVYRHKLHRGNYPHRDGSKLMNESNQLTSWSDSQMHDGSSFFNSTDKHEDSKRESRSWKTGSSDLCENVYGNYWETSYCHERSHGSGSTTPATERPLNRDSLSLLETPKGKSVAENIPSDSQTMTELSRNSSALDVLEQGEESIVTETSEGCPLQSTSSNIVEICDNGIDNDVNNDDDLALKVDLMEKNDNSSALSLLPPPLPTSPSESWLQRTLPSMSSKDSHQQSFLGIQFHTKSRFSWASTGGHKSVKHEKPSSLRSHQTMFVEVAKGT